MILELESDHVSTL